MFLLHSFYFCSCKKEVDPLKVIDISKVATNTGTYEGVIVAQLTLYAEMLYVDEKCNLYVGTICCRPSISCTRSGR
jgi:hypothetical protein